MKRIEAKDMTIEQLVSYFAALALEQDDALLMDEIERFNRVFDQMELIKHELRKRAGDQRRALATLFQHSNAQVRLKAAKATLSVLPDAARAVLRAIVEQQEFPQAGDAGMTLSALDDGTFVPT